MWPSPSPSQAFVERRARFVERFPEPAILAAGLRRVRNFPHNTYPFRPESHFLYFVGRAIEGAFLTFEGDGPVLYAPEPDPEAALWTGAEPSLGQLEQELQLQVRPINALDPHQLAGAATVPPQDLESAVILAEILDRDLEAGGGADVAGQDAVLADALIEQRLHHDRWALDQLRQAAAVTVDAHRAGMQSTRAGIREARVRATMEAVIIASGMTTAYGSIVTRRGEVLHNERHDGTLEASDLLLADVGAETPEGWAADVTRTWPVSGRFDGPQRDIYQAVLASQLAAIEAVKPGAEYESVHRAAGDELVKQLVDLGVLRGDPRELAARGAASLFFPHGVGHLLGLDVHDMEDLGDRAGYAPGRSRSTEPGLRFLRLSRVLEPDMVVTIEPGFYWIEQMLAQDSMASELEAALDRQVLERFRSVRGIRIEDDVRVTESGCEVLTSAAPKTTEAIEALMAEVAAA